MNARLDWLGRQTEAIEQRESSHIERLEELRNRAAIEAVTRWVRHARLRSRPLVSVVLPTRDRTELLTHAISSVVAQRYENWELLVVDDGGSEDSRAVVEASADPRIRWSRIEASGVCGARNHGLEMARGELVAYLDDDNFMAPGWLYALVWAFEQRPEINVLYGAFVVDDYERLTGRSSGALPWTFLHPWSRDAIAESNLADIGSIAHRAGLPGAWFDPGVEGIEDWDLLVRLTAEDDPLVLPAISHYYSTDASNRMTNDNGYERNYAVVRARAKGQT